MFYPPLLVLRFLFEYGRVCCLDLMDVLQLGILGDPPVGMFCEG